MPGGVPEGFVLLTHKRVIRVAAKMFECSEASFSARCRFPEAVLRRTAVVLALRKLSLSLPEIGRVLKRHHTTILSLERRGLADPRVAAAAVMIVELATTP
jgi:chromosomal replication initiation ATPase DnaA